MKKVFVIVSPLILFTGCQLTELCPTGMHKEGSECVINPRKPTECGWNPSKNCISEYNMSIAFCQDEKCGAITCNEGYHTSEPDMSHKDVIVSCVKDSPESCGESSINCNDLIQHAKTKCSKGKCEVDGGCTDDGYKLKQVYFDPYQGSTCIQEEALNCGAEGEKIDCTNANPYAVNVACYEQKCKQESCKTDFHLEDGKCVQNTADQCGKEKLDCSKSAVSNSESMVCYRGQCKVEKCKTNFHEMNNKCEPDNVEACGSITNNCLNMPNTSAVKCEAGKCIIEKCNEGYTENKDKTVCLSKDTSLCGSEKCNEIPNVADVSCKNEKCVVNYCITGYHVKDNTCIKDENTLCGNDETNCTEIYKYQSETSCENGKCKLLQCIDGYNLVGDDCQPDINSVNNCGGSSDTLVDCTKISGIKDADSVKCENGKCIILACAEKYQVMNNQCVLVEDNNNDIENCGGVNCTQIPHVIKSICNKEEKCDVIECEDDYKPSGDKCKSLGISIPIGGYTPTNCGGINCVEKAKEDPKTLWNPTCESVQCKFTICKDGTEPNEDHTACICESSSNTLIDPSNCGVCGTSCGNNTNTGCNEGVCTEGQGFALCDNALFDLSNNEYHCGSCDNHCSSSEDCSNGKCSTMEFD